jgi:predicted dehydrogenase
MGITRRDILKGLVSFPIFGIFFHQFFQKKNVDHYRRNQILSELKLNGKAPAVIPVGNLKKNGQLIKLGIIGFGSRGEDLARSLGFAHPQWIASQKKSAEKNRLDSRLKDWLAQEDLNVAITGICDVFELHAENGVAAATSNVHPAAQNKTLPPTKKYRDYRKMLENPDIDAVLISTPDFHHARMMIEAIKAGKHVYCEKCMTRTEEEVYQVVEAMKNSKVVFQLGHQYPQTGAFAKAQEIVQKDILGKITLVETTSNRNTPHGAWIRHLDDNGNPKPGNPQTIDWDLWLGDRPKVPFSIDRYYNWTKWWDYATGLSGQLFCHEFDAVNQILNIGIPKSAVASGGIYYFKDNREIPDVFHAVFEFPDNELTLIYSASLASSRERGRVFMGHNASMEVGNALTVTADEDSTRFKEKIEKGIIDTSLPLFTYQPGTKGIDAITSATEKYYATRGLVYTYRGGKRVDTTHLHIKEWLDCIRFGGTPSCHIDKAYQVTIACHMATKSYQEKRRVEWDPVKKRII